GKGVAQGGVTAALQPTTGEGDFWTQKAEQTGAGAAAGGIAAPFFRLVGKAIGPKPSAEVQTLTKEGVEMTPGQIAGGAAKAAEEKATSLPILGDAIANAHKRGLESFNRAAINRTLAPIGAELPEGVVGRGAVKYADETLGKAYDALLPKITVHADDE